MLQVINVLSVTVVSYTSNLFLKTYLFSEENRLSTACLFIKTFKIKTNK